MGKRGTKIIAECIEELENWKIWKIKKQNT